jgi:hypothetical protein
MAYRNFKVNKLVGKRAHLVVEAEFVFATVVRREDEVALPLLLPIHNDLAARARHLIVNVEGAA